MRKPNLKELLFSWNPVIEYLNDRIDKLEKRSKITNHVYGIYIDGNNSNPSTRVTYIEDAIGMKSAFMNYETGKFDLNKANLIAYSHGQYFTLGDYVGKFGYSVQKKK